MTSIARRGRKQVARFYTSARILSGEGSIFPINPRHDHHIPWRMTLKPSCPRRSSYPGRPVFRGPPPSLPSHRFEPLLTDDQSTTLPKENAHPRACCVHEKGAKAAVGDQKRKGEGEKGPGTKEEAPARRRGEVRKRRSSDMNAVPEIVPMADVNRFRHGMNMEEGTQLKVSSPTSNGHPLKLIVPIRDVASGS